MPARHIGHMHQAQQVHIAPQGSQQRRNPTPCGGPRYW
jgi:hypothetical protein